MRGVKILVQENRFQEFSFTIRCDAVVNVADVRDWFKNRLQILIENRNDCFLGVKFDRYPYELNDDGQSCNMSACFFLVGKDITGKVVLEVANDISAECLNSLLQNTNDGFNLLEIRETNNY